MAVITALPMAAIGGMLAWIVKQVTMNISERPSREAISLWIALAFFGVIIRSGLGIINQYLMTQVHAKMTNDIRLDLFDKALQAPLAFHTHIRTGALANLLNNDVQFASGGVIELYSTFWQYPVSLLVLLSTMFYFNPIFSLVAVITLPFLCFCVAKLSKRARRAEFQFMENAARMQGHIVETLINVQQVKYYSLRDRQIRKLAQDGDNLAHYRVKSALLSALVSPTSDILGCLALGIMALIAYSQLKTGFTTPDKIAGCLAAAVGVMKPLKGLSQSIVMLQRSFAAVARFNWAHEHLVPSGQDRKKVVEVFPIEFTHVVFSYDNRLDVLQDISLLLDKGDRIALIGPSGAGKTTLLDLLSGFYPCSEGQITIAGHDLAGIDLDSWYEKIGIVSQEPLLFDDTMAANIRHGNPRAEEPRIIAAAEMAGCRKMLQRFPDGINTKVGERGCLLSGGERKRVALARALVRPISILVLDEATSELDLDTEKDILQVIDRLPPEMIILHISHRPSILPYCNRILLIEQGKVREITADEAKQRYRHHEVF